MTDNRIFWKTILLHFPKKVSKGENINLIENWNVISSNEEFYSTFNDVFANTVSNLSIPTIAYSHSN